MNELRLVSKSEHQLKPIIEAALENELRLIEAGIKQTEQHLKKFEDKYQLNTRDFIKHKHTGESVQLFYTAAF